jgi:hypothetical protein
MRYKSTHTYSEYDIDFIYDYMEDKSMFNQVFNLHNPDIEIEQ